jgi:hypothetical protein
MQGRPLPLFLACACLTVPQVCCTILTRTAVRPSVVGCPAARAAAYISSWNMNICTAHAVHAAHRPSGVCGRGPGAKCTFLSLTDVRERIHGAVHSAHQSPVSACAVCTGMHWDAQKMCHAEPRLSHQPSSSHQTVQQQNGIIGKDSRQRCCHWICAAAQLGLPLAGTNCRTCHSGSCPDMYQACAELVQDAQACVGSDTGGAYASSSHAGSE